MIAMPREQPHAGGSECTLQSARHGGSTTARRTLNHQGQPCYPLGVANWSAWCIVALLSSSFACGRIGYDPLNRADASLADTGNADADADANQADADTDNSDAGEDVADSGGDPCVPSRLAAACDADGDGIGGDVDPDNENPCIPSSIVPACYAGPGCPGLPFEPPVLIGELSTPTSDDFCPFLSADGLEIFFESNRGGSPEIWRATRADAMSSFDPPSVVAELTAPPGGEVCAVLSLDGLEIFFERDGRIRRSTRTAVGGPFAPDTEVTELNPNPSLPSFDALGPFLSADGLRLYYALKVPSGSPAELAVARRINVNTAFVFDRLLSEVNASSSKDGWPTVSGNELELFYKSDRICVEGGPCLFGTSSNRVLRAVRTSTSVSFDPPAEATEFSIGIESGQPKLSPDGNTMVFYARLPPDFLARIYMSKRACNP
jgi:hypothetical protein